MSEYLCARASVIFQVFASFCTEVILEWIIATQETAIDPYAAGC